MCKERWGGSGRGGCMCSNGDRSLVSLRAEGKWSGNKGKQKREQRQDMRGCLMGGCEYPNGNLLVQIG